MAIQMIQTNSWQEQSEQFVTCAAWRLLRDVIQESLEEARTIRRLVEEVTPDERTEIVAKARYLWNGIEAALKPGVCEYTQL